MLCVEAPFFWKVDSKVTHYINAYVRNTYQYSTNINVSTIIPLQFFYYNIRIYLSSYLYVQKLIKKSC